jgi:hypothetical protein
MLRWVAVVCSAALMSGCSYTYTSQPNMRPSLRVDDMIVSVDDVRHIADAEDLATRSEVDTHKPPPADASAPEPCRPVGHNDLTFGSGWSEFRSAGYHGVTDDIEPLGNSMVNGVTQAVARYPNADKAKAAFHLHCTTPNTTSPWTSRIPQRYGSPTISGVTCIGSKLR